MLRAFYNILVVIFLVTTLSSCTNEYWEFHAQKEATEKTQAQVESGLKTFSPDKIVARDVEILTTPDKRVIDRMVSLIASAKREVSVEVYILTEKRIIKALQEAKARGITVRVILEKNVYGAGSINANAYKSLKNAGVDVVYASNDLYNFTHSKLLIVDDTYLITTGNFSYSSFTTNREWYIIGSNPEDLAHLKDIFARDFAHEPWSGTSDTLVVSPIDSRTKIEQTLESTGSWVLIYAQTFWDDRIRDILATRRARKIPVTICIADPKKIPSNSGAIQELRARDVDVRISKKPVIHAKAFLVDERYAYIGSENYTTNSLDHNREIGMLLRVDPEFVARFKKTFYADCPKSGE